jgi:hypothetical protein
VGMIGTGGFICSGVGSAGEKERTGGTGAEYVILRDNARWVVMD